MTDNFRDFPSDKVPDGIQITGVQDFAYETVSVHLELGLAAVRAMSERSGRKGTKQTPVDILDELAKTYSLDATTDLLRGLL
ncbi:hypothetical protein LJ754_04490 [Arthrobacter sp. zg-Y40]|nr:hypothetical protein [Arthrobacter sp. zg-Y40]